MAFRITLALAVLLTSGPAACGPSLVRNPAPEAFADLAQPFGRAGMRDWGDSLSREEVEAVFARRAPFLKARFGGHLAAGRQLPTLEFLALSGGGQWGEFGAGVLNAWSDSGTRPDIFGVSGVSTGAIITPFAFLGPDYDQTLLEIYSEYRADQLVTTTMFSGIASGTALTDTTLLANVIERYITPVLVEKIALEHRKGRTLFIGTTNLDAGRPVVWDIGAIANSGEAGAFDLIHQFIRASTSFPVAFPPIFVNVRTPNGQVFNEMHVDGGPSSQVTFISPRVPIAEATRAVLGRNLDRRVWVIVNNDLEPPHHSIRSRLSSIGEAAVSSLISGSGVSNVYRPLRHLRARRDRVQRRVDPERHTLSRAQGAVRYRVHGVSVWSRVRSLPQRSALAYRAAVLRRAGQQKDGG